MHKWIAAVLIAGWLFAPGVAAARWDQGLKGDILGVQKEQILIIGAGVVAGALVLHLVVPGDLTYFAGGVVGGLAALWWYENGGEEKLRPVLKVDLTGTAADASGAPGGARLEGLALGR